MFSIKQVKDIKYVGFFRKGLNTSKEDHVKALIEEREGKKIYTLTIKFADYTSIDDSRDKMLRGCFNQSFERAKTSNRKIGFLWQHDRHDPIGRIVDFWEDESGAYVKAELSDFDAVPNAKRTWYQVLDGTLNQASFGYKYDWEATRYVAPEVAGEDGYFTVGNVILREISIVTFGDNENTKVMDAREAEKALHEAEELRIKSLQHKQEMTKSEQEPPRKGFFGR